jgi:predicted nucleic acid-binding protein
VILVDAGPLVALIHADDQQHQRCKETLATLREPMLTVWPAFTEAMYLLGFSGAAQQLLWEILESDSLWMADLQEQDYPRLRQLMRKYSDLPMDLADAALVRVAEREHISRIFTIDRRDFEVYRPTGIRRFAIVP